MQWTWNESDCDNWYHDTFDTKEEAIRDAYEHREQIEKRLSCVDEAVIFVGQCQLVPLRTDLDADHTLEYLNELYCDDSGCDYYIYEGVSKEDEKWLEERLSDVIEEFHKKIGIKASWFNVVNMESFLMR